MPHVPQAASLRAVPGLDELRQKVRSKRQGARQVSDVVAQLADSDVADFVAYLADHVSVSKLGELVGHPEAQRLFNHSIPVTTQKRVVSGLSDWLDAPSKHVWRWDINAYLATEVPAIKGPQRPDEAVKWAEDHDVVYALEHPAANAAPLSDKHVRWHLRNHYEGTVGDLVRGAKVGYRAVEDAAKTAATQYLRWAERRHRLAQRRVKTWASRPKEPQLQLLSHRIKAALRILDDSHIRPVVPVGGIVVLPDIGGTATMFKSTEHGQQSVGVPFAGYEHLPLRLDMEHPAELRVVLEWTLDAIHERKSPIRPALLEVLSEPSWARLVDELETVLEKAEEPSRKDVTERIVFRIDPLDDDSGLTRIEVSGAVQKRGKNGRWSAGAVKPAQKLIEHSAARREDLVALDLISIAENASSNRFVAFAEAAAALRGHPRVEHGETKERIRVRRTPPTVALEPLEGGHKLTIRVDDYEVTNYETDARLVAFDGDETLHVADVSDKLGAFIRATESFPALLPPAARARVLSLLPRLQPDAGLVIPTELRGVECDAQETLVVRLTPDESGLELDVCTRPLQGGPTWPPGDGPRLAFGQKDNERVHALRNFDAERVRMRALLDAIDLPLSATQRIEGLDRALDVIGLLQGQEGIELEWPEGRKAWSVGATGDLRVRVLRAGEWFGVEGGVEVDGEEVPLTALLQAVRRGQRYVRVSKGRFAKIEEDLRSRIETTSDALIVDGADVKVGIGAVEVIDQLGVVEADDEWRDVIARAKAAKDIKPPLPEGLVATLRDYQQEGFEWMSRLASWGAGACLADEMGLGKTVQTLAMLLDRANEGPSLVVAPTSVGPGWESEAAKFTPSLDIRMYRGAKRDKELQDLGPGVVLITSYDVLARDGELLSEIEFGSVVFDEAQAIKNARTRRAKSARLINSKWRVALTGTPLENHLGEVWSIYRTVSPGLLGPWEHFRRHYALPIERDGDAVVQQKLIGRLRPFLLRRTKAEVASELPPRTEVVVPVELSEKERRLYDATRDEAIASLGSPERFAVLAALTRLRRLACHPRLVVPSWSESSAKLDAFLNLTSELIRDGHRALVFSQFTSHLAIVREALDFRSISSLYMDGKTPAKKRQALIDGWQDGNDPIFLISLKAGGTGLNLTAADTVIHLDPWWNPAVEDQASDRAHRIGQDKPVTVVRLVAQDTIEEKVLLLHRSKRDLADALLAGGDTATKLQVADLISLMET
ncbi:MAG: superfamily II DNA or RNA helicase [Polyangiales bacterium]